MDPVKDCSDLERVWNRRLGNDGSLLSKLYRELCNWDRLSNSPIHCFYKSKVNVKTSGKSGAVESHGSINLLRKTAQINIGWDMNRFPNLSFFIVAKTWKSNHSYCVIWPCIHLHVTGLGFDAISTQTICLN